LRCGQWWTQEVAGTRPRSILPLATKEFPGGCVVRDFYQQVGITIDKKRIQQVNESLSMDAVRFLECYRRYGNRERSSGFWPPIHHHWLVTRLRA
jgi:hypothetical protein